MLTQQQQDIWKDRYALSDSEGNTIEQSIHDTWERVAKAIGDTAHEVTSFRELLEDFKFVPGGRILAGAGAESDKTFYNCYVIPVETKERRKKNRGQDAEDKAGNDSREAIFDTIGTMVGIMSRGGGVGVNWSTLRPRGSYLTRVSGNSSGPVGWMDVASTAVGEVIQGGSRRGAAMFMLDVWHPDVLQFINAKRDNKKITNANISVSISDSFMEAVRNDDPWTFMFPDTTYPEYNAEWDGDIDKWTFNGGSVVYYDSMPAREVWSQISESAHASGEPGVIFLDRYNDLSTANGLEKIICVNPCGEQGLGAYSVCNLGAMNLYAYMKDGSFKWTSFAYDVMTAISFLDRVIDKTPNYLPETVARQESLRRIGLGVMGLADTFIALGIRYGSSESVDFTDKVFRTMKDAAIHSSQILAHNRGAAGGWDDSIVDRPYLKEYTERTGNVVGPMRNIFLLTQAPTGTTSLLAGVNSGIEPYFNLETWREDRTGGRYVKAKAVEELFLPVGAVLPDHVVTSREVSVQEHIAIQAATQRYVDSSVSKTVNAPKEQTVEETRKVFDLAYDSGLKGVAYYRDGSRDVQVLYHEKPTSTSALEERIMELEAKLAFKDRVISGMSGGSPLVPAPQGSQCPRCEHGEIVFEESCQKCHSCGWSAC